MGTPRKTTECAGYIELALPYLDRKLSPDQRRAVEDHLRRCPECRREYSVFMELKRLDHAKEQGAVDPEVLMPHTAMDLAAVAGDVPTLHDAIRGLESIHQKKGMDVREQQKALIQYVHRFLTDSRRFLRSRRVVRAGREWLKLERRLARLLRRILAHPVGDVLSPLMHLQAEAYISRGLIFQLQGDVTHAEQNLSQSVVILWALKDPEALQTQRFLGELKFYEGDVSSAEELFASALRDPDTPPAEQALLLRNLGNVAYIRGQFSECRQYLEQAMSISLSLNDTEFPARDLMNLSTIDFHRNDLDRAIHRTREALAYLHDNGHIHLQGQLYANLGTFLAAKGDIDDARTQWQYALDAFKEGFFLKDAAQVMRNIALQDYQSGRLDAALNILLHAGSEHQAPDALNVQIQLLTGRIYRWQRDWRNALKYLNGAETGAADLNEYLLREAVLLEKSFIHLDKGNLRDALDLLEQTDASKKRRKIANPSVFELENEVSIIRLYAALGYSTDAGRCARRLKRMVREYRKQHPVLPLKQFPTGESWSTVLENITGIFSE